MSKGLSKDQIDRVCRTLGVPPKMAATRLAICTRLFDDTTHLHGLTKTARPILQAAALHCAADGNGSTATPADVFDALPDEFAPEAQRTITRCTELMGTDVSDQIHKNARKATDEIALRLCAVLRIANELARVGLSLSGAVDDASAVELVVCGGSLSPGDAREIAARAALWNALMPRPIGTVRAGGKKRSLPGLIRPCDTLSGAARRILLRQLEQLLSRTYGLGIAWDVEYVHEMRVALRRSRGALRLFRGVLGEARSAFNDELKWLAGSLGGARDADVLLLFLREYAEQVPDGHRPFVEGLVRSVKTKRRKHFHEVLDAFGSDRFEQFKATYFPMLRQTIGPDNELFPATPRGAEVTCGRAPKLLLKQLRNAIRPGGRLELCSPEELHELRIRCKRLRYAAEFLADVYGGGLLEVAWPMVWMQDDLGDVHDSDVYTERIIRYSERRKSGGEAAREAAETLLEHLAQRRAESLNHAAKTWREFTSKKNLKEVTRRITSPLKP